MAQSKHSWLAREVSGDGRTSEPFVVSYWCSIAVLFAAEQAARKLDEMDELPPEHRWPRTIEIETTSGVWERFRVQSEVKVEYAAERVDGGVRYRVEED